MGTRQSRPSQAKISMYLRPSKYWWAWLGLQSNPALLARLDAPVRRAIFFDDLALLPPAETAPAPLTNRYFFLFWDGFSDEAALARARQRLGPNADLTVVVVGDATSLEREKYRIENLYPEGELRFLRSPLRFDRRTAAILLGAKIKTLMMPLKNMAQTGVRPAASLLMGSRKIVFCGSYGTIPSVIESFCHRYGADFRLFANYEYYSAEPNPSLQIYQRYLRSNGIFLADLYDRSGIDDRFFLAAVHLLGREYFIEQIRAAGLPLYANGFDTGVNVNVYTTPFYRQHVFLDFGSAVGPGNYPRLADLRYFRKQVVAIDLAGELEPMLALARAGKIEQHFESEWERKAPQLRQAMARPLT